MVIVVDHSAFMGGNCYTFDYSYNYHCSFITHRLNRKEDVMPVELAAAIIVACILGIMTGLVIMLQVTIQILARRSLEKEKEKEKTHG